MDYVSSFKYIYSSKPTFLSVKLVLAAKKNKVAKLKCCSPLVEGQDPQVVHVKGSEIVGDLVDVRSLMVLVHLWFDATFDSCGLDSGAFNLTAQKPLPIVESPIAHCPLPIAHCLLPIVAHCPSEEFVISVHSALV
jgi:hypothetical protein